MLYVCEVKILRQRKKSERILVMCQVLHCQEILCYKTRYKLIFVKFYSWSPDCFLQCLQDIWHQTLMCLQLGLRSTVPPSWLSSLCSLRCPCKNLTLYSWADTGSFARWRSLWVQLAQGFLLRAVQALASQHWSCSWWITAALGGEEIPSISKASVHCT